MSSRTTLSPRRTTRAGGLLPPVRVLTFPETAVVALSAHVQVERATALLASGERSGGGIGTPTPTRLGVFAGLSQDGPGGDRTHDLGIKSPAEQAEGD
jgi:hypothetical protein